MIRIGCVFMLAWATALFAQQPRPPVVTNGPVVLQQVKPDFGKCRVAGAMNAKSEVVVSLRVKEDGTADLTGIDQGSGNACVDEEALRIVRQYRFRPAMKDGQPVAVRIKMSVAVQIYKR